MFIIKERLSLAIYPSVDVVTLQSAEDSSCAVVVGRAWYLGVKYSVSFDCSTRDLDETTREESLCKVRRDFVFDR